MNNRRKAIQDLVHQFCPKEPTLITETSTLPLAVPSFGQAEIEEALDTLLSGWLTMGERVFEFERRWAKYIGVSESIAVNSGSSALLVMLSAMVECGYLHRGQEVIVPAVGWSTSLFSVAQAGLNPVVVDVDADGEAEIVCSCIDREVGENNSVNPRHTVVFESDTTPWVSTRTVWNSSHYTPTFVNEDLTIPTIRQDKAAVKGLDLWGAQTPLLNTIGEPVLRGLQDYNVQIDSVSKSCDLETTTAHVKICKEVDNALVFDFDVSFYQGDPKNNGTLIGTERIDHSASLLATTECMTIDYTIPWGEYELHVFVNDRGINPGEAPVLLMPECDITNNQASKGLSKCTQEVDPSPCFIMMTDFED